MVNLYIVLPCYNEQEVLPETHKRLKLKYEDLLAKNIISKDSRIVFVNDGSKDKTWELISKFHQENSIFSGLNLSRNRGHQNALLAGLLYSYKYADCVISMDADLQDDINAIDEMLLKYSNGAEIVYGVRKARKKDTFFKRYTAESFYKVINKMGGEVIFNHADYRLMSKKAIEGLNEFSEFNLFLRGLVPMVGFKSDLVFYERDERFAGSSKYPLKKMLSFAYEGITSLTTKPISMIRNTGLTFAILGFAAFVVAFVLYFLNFKYMLLLSILFYLLHLSGLIIFSIGIIGDYVGKTYLETKKRPRYIISEILNDVE